MKHAFIVQHDATEPNGWKRVEAENYRLAACEEAAKHGPGYVIVYVAPVERNLHPNGTPIKVFRMGLSVTKRPQEVNA